MRRIVIAVFSAGWLAGCAAAEPPAPAPQPVAEDTAAVEVVEPEIPLEERWRAPFAVQSRGDFPRRGPRAPVVRGERDPVVTAAGAEPAADPGDTAASADSTAPAEPRAPEPAAPARDANDGAPAPRAAAPAAPASAGSATGLHRVAAGETFYGIALRYGMTFSQLRAANPGVDPDRIRVGQELRVPRSGGGGSSGRAAPAAPSRRTHTVAAGETLWGIARRYGVPAERIREANALDEDDRVRVGQRLVIPGAE